MTPSILDAHRELLSGQRFHFLLRTYYKPAVDSSPRNTTSLFKPFFMNPPHTAQLLRLVCVVVEKGPLLISITKSSHCL